MRVDNFQTIVVDWMPSVPSDTYNAGEVMAATEEVAVVPSVGGGGMRGAITNVSILDKGTNDSAITVMVFNQNTSIGTEGEAMTLTDADSENIITAWNSSNGNACSLVNSIYKSGDSIYVHEPKYFHSDTGSLWIAVRNGGPSGMVRALNPLYIRIGIMLENIAVA